MPGFNYTVCMKKLTTEAKFFLRKLSEMYVAFIDLNVDIILLKQKLKRNARSSF